MNLGVGGEITIAALTALIARVTRFEGETRWPDGEPRRALDVSRARDRFAFVAETSLEDGLRRAIASYE